MTENQKDTEDTYENDSWLTAVFAAAAGPFVDSAFADRILARLRRRDRLRIMVILGTVLFSALITTWQAAGLVGAMPTLNVSIFNAPEWLSNTRTAFVLALVTAAGFAVWMVAEEA